MSLFKDKIAIVTGGGSGIGREVCCLLAEKGAVVVAADIDMKNAEETAKLINMSGGMAKAENLDVTCEKDVFKLVQDIKSEYGKLDYMFNNAGITITGQFLHIETEHWRRIMNIDFWGVLYGTKAAYAVMVEQGFGHIINTSSMAGLVPTSLEIPYTAAKFAVVALSAALREEGAHAGVDVSVVCPGLINTPIWDTTKVTPEQKEVSARLEEIIGETSLKTISPKKAARYILQGIKKNKPYIVFPFHARFSWWLYRLCPSIVSILRKKTVTSYMKV